MTHEQRMAAEVALTQTVRRREQLERTITEQVATMRAVGATWDDVAHALGVTRQAAHKRYGWVARDRGGDDALGIARPTTTDQCTCRVSAQGTRREYRVLNRECPVHGDAAETRRNGDQPATLQPVPKVDKPPPPRAPPRLSHTHTNVRSSRVVVHAVHDLLPRHVSHHGQTEPAVILVCDHIIGNRQNG